MDGRRYEGGRRRLRLAAAIGILSLVALGGVTAAAGQAETTAGNVTLYATATAEFDDAGSIESALDSGTLEPTRTVVVGETLLVEIDSDRLADDLDSRDGTPTERFFSALEADADIAMRQTNPSMNLPRKEVRLGPDNTTVYRNGTTTFVSIDTGAVDPTFGLAQSDQASEASLRRGDRFAVTFGYDGTGSDRGSGAEFRFAEPTFLESSPVLAPEIVNKSVRVDVEPERELIVRATFEDGTNATETPARVSWSEFLGVSLDVRDVTPGTNYTLELVRDGDVVDRQHGVVREPEATTRDAEVSLVETDEYVAELNLTAELSHGGTVIILDGFGARIGSAQVPPDTVTELSIALRNPDPETEFQPDRLRIRAVRDGERVERQYPDAELTLDVSEYEWDPTDWTPTASTDTASPDTPERNHDTYTVGDGPSDSTTGFDTLAGRVGIVGTLSVLVGTGYVLRRRFSGR